MVAPNVVKKVIRRAPIDAPAAEVLAERMPPEMQRPRPGAAAFCRRTKLPQEIELMMRPISLSVAEVPILGRLWMKLTLLAIEAVRLVVASLTLETP